MRICTILGKGYEEIEAIGTLALLKRSGLEADLYGISGEKTTGKLQPASIIRLKP